MSKVLLVEDDNNLREIYEARLQAEGYIINSAKDGEEALVVAKAEKPDLIISDVMMPKISGFEMLDILRNTEGLKETKVIMLTALGQADDRTRADSLGADRYLVKSQVTLEDIVKAAHELLEPDTVAAPVAEPVVATSAPVTVTAAPEVAPAPTSSPIPVQVETVAVAPAPTPAADVPASAASAAPVAPVDVPAPTPVAAPAEPTVAPSSPELTPLELPGAPSEASALTPTAPVETPAVPSAADLPATESTAEEQATVDSQIEDFIKNTAEVPPETQPAVPNATTDRVMQESVDTLIASTEPETGTPTTEGPAVPTTAPTPSEPTVIAPTPKVEDGDGVTIAHKKVIARPGASNQPDLNELLAREEAKNIVTGDAPQSDTPIVTPATPGQATTPGNTFAPTSETPAPKPNDETDPNSIAL